MEKVLSLHNLIHLLNIQLTGTRYTVSGIENLDPSRPVILVSNHQSMYDIPLIMWNLRSRRPKFIAKIELVKWIPSISFSLRNGGHILIDRKKAKNSIEQIGEAGEHFEKTLGVISIFPEGTRSKDGTPRPFKVAGFQALLKSMPSAQIIPVTLDGTAKIVTNKLFPVPLSVPVLLKIHKAIQREDRDAEQLLRECEAMIKNELMNWRASIQ